MELYTEILAHYLSQEHAQIIFPNLQFNAGEITQMQCYQTLLKIKSIIEDDTLEDAECFMRIEEVVRRFEEIGSNGGNRHDFS